MAQGDPPGAIAMLVLEDEDPRSALTNTKPKAMNIIVPEQGFGLAWGEGELGDIGAGQLHAIFPEFFPGGAGASGALRGRWEPHGKIRSYPKRGQATPRDYGYG